MRLVVIFLSLIYFVKSQDEATCRNKETCSECVQTLGCIWCKSPIWSNSSGLPKIFCASKDMNDLSSWCPPHEVYSPESNSTILEDDLLQFEPEKKPIQIKPQRIKLSLRKGQEHTIPFQYRRAENYPVDLYYIMDLSASMENHREKLAELGEQLAETMRTLTSDFHLGFGSFVDKTDMPFISTLPEKLESPCSLTKKDKSVVICVPPYSFKNHMSLTADARAFSDEVRKAKVSGNLDFPEGGLDAVMQAIVCKKEIGWRENARHIIVFSTDADFHMAGDGKLAGVVEPNDAKCHMENNTYTHDLVYDYPSISHINYVAKQNNINIIFAIVAQQKYDRVLQIYEMLHQRIENSAVGGLSQNSGNVVNLIVDNYNKIVDSVVMADDSGNGIDIKYSSNCSKPRENGCSNIHVGETINFIATITPLQCNPAGSKTQLIKIKPEGVSDSLEIELEILCNCPCEQPESPDFITNSSECGNNGDLKCGTCSCYPGKFGRNCECDGTSIGKDDVSACRIHPNDTEYCSGLGSCKCGRCDCQKRPYPNLIYGPFCNCDNFSCKRYNEQVCSGSDRGHCDCGECKCLAGWTGEICECPATNASCIAPGGDGSVCSGRGSCVCGDCQCEHKDNSRYSGIYCEECSTCSGQRCDELRYCVECQAFPVESTREEECNIRCNAFTTEVIEKIDEDALDADVKICRTPDASGCTIIYQYSYNNDKDLVVKAQKTKLCTESVNIFVLFLSVIGSIVLAGLILLIIWKAFTVMHDRREYAKFENERKNAKWHGDGNPLYKKATSEFQNPVYRS